MPVKASRQKDDWTILLLDRDSEGAVPSGTHFRLLQKAPCEHVETLRNLFVLCSASELSEVSDLVSSVNRRHHLKALLVRQDTDADWLPQLFERANLRVLRNTLVHSDITIPRRVLTAWKYRAEKKLIANATVVDDRLMVISCEPEVLEVSFDELPSLRRVPKRDRAKFSISDDGSYLHWESLDIHLDIDAIRSATDPTWKDKCMVQRMAHDARYGAAIAQLRRDFGLRQTDIPDLSDRQLRRIENGEAPTAGALRALSSAHGMDLHKYLAALAEAAADGSSA